MVRWGELKGHPFFTKIGMYLDNHEVERERVYAIESVAQNKKLIEEIASLRAQIAKIEAEKRIEKEEQSEREKEIEISKRLNEEDKKLRKEDLGEVISLNAFFQKIYGVKIPKGESDFRYRSKWGKKFEISDRNEEVSNVFGEMLISSKGYFIITDISKQILVRVPLPQGLFYKPSSLRNQIRKNRFILGVDKNQEFVPDWDELEVPVPVWNEENYEYETGERMVKARDLIIEKDTLLRFKDNKIEQLEIIINDLKRDYSEVRRSLGLALKKSSNSESDLSSIMTTVYQIMSKDHEKSAKLVNLSESIAMKEQENRVLDANREELLTKIESAGGKTKKELVKAEFRDAADFVHTIPQQMVKQNV